MKNLVLKNLIELSCKVVVYVPSTIDVDKKINNKEQVNNTIHFLSNCFGGATSQLAQGSWETEQGKTVTEKINLVYSFCTSEQLESKIESVYNYCLELKQKMNQENISLEINNKLYFV